MTKYLKYGYVFFYYLQYKYFNYATIFLFISEIGIWLFTSSFFIRKQHLH